MKASLQPSTPDPRHLSHGREIPTESYSDQPFVVQTDDNAWLCCVTTGPGHEGVQGQHVTTLRSTDQGRSWSEPVPVEPGDNTKPEGWGWYPRDPLWIAVAREVPGVTENAGLHFSEPKVVIYNDGVPGGPFKDFEIGYPQFYHFGGRNFVAYANKTCQLRINEVPDALLEYRLDSRRSSRRDGQGG